MNRMPFTQNNNSIGSVLFITHTDAKLSFIVKYSKASQRITNNTLSFIMKYIMVSQRITMQRWTPFNRQHIDWYALWITPKTHTRMLGLKPNTLTFEQGSLTYDEWCISMSSERRYSQLHPIETLSHINHPERNIRGRLLLGMWVFITLVVPFISHYSSPLHHTLACP
jgi:hypothetical protein